MSDTASIPTLLDTAEGKTLYVDGEPFLMRAGEVHNSTSSSIAWMGRAWEKAGELGMNTLLTPVTWELVEPVEGTFDFSGVDALIDQAREQGGHLVLLWFGAWKNGQCSYAPAWVKRDTDRFWRAEPVKGVRKMALKDFYNFPYTTLSAFCEETLRMDARAFARLMAHLRDYDAERHTVLAIQVENECGLQGAARDHVDAADAAFLQEVPEGLVSFMRENVDGLAPDIASALSAGTGAGSWKEVFGPCAEELFQTYHTARYVNTVAEAGRREYPLPTLANSWLDKGEAPGVFPTGGPNARVLEVWRWAAPSIDVCSPDIYIPAFCETCDAFRKLGNPLLVPETATHAYAAARTMWAIGHHHALACSPFGFEEMGEPFSDETGALLGMDTSDPALRTPQDPTEYQAVNEALSGLFTHAGGYGAMEAVISECGRQQTLELGSWHLDVAFGDAPGAVLVLPEGEDGAYLLVLNATVTLVSSDEALPHVDLALLEDGSFDQNGRWVADRRLNGDEVLFLRYEEPTLLRMEVLSYR